MTGAVQGVELPRGSLMTTVVILCVFTAPLAGVIRLI